MILGINAGFGDVITADMARKAREFGIRDIRFDVLQSGKQGRDDLMPMDIVEDSLRACAGEGLSATCLLSGKLKLHRITPDKVQRRFDEIDRFLASVGGDYESVSFEPGSEGNDPSWRYTPQEMAAMTRVLEGVPYKVIALVSNNTGRNGLAYTRACIDAGLYCPALAIHPYRTTVRPNEACPDGWATREDEWHELDAIYDGPLWATEVGWHSRLSVVRKGVFGIGRKTVKFSEEQKAEFFRAEMDILESHGVSRVHWFQWSNGPDSDAHHEAGYGMFDAAGEPLPLAWAMKAWTEEREAQ